SEDLRAPPQRSEDDLFIGSLNLRLASQPEIAAQEPFHRAARAEQLRPFLHLDDAFVAPPGSAARGWHDHREIVGIVEETAANNRHAPALPRGNGAHSLSCRGAEFLRRNSASSRMRLSFSRVLS